MSKTYGHRADSAADPGAEKQGKILIIDDEESAVRVLTQLLERAGYQVSAAQNAKDGLFLQREDPADLVIMDIFMPDLNGLEAIQRLKKTSPDTPIFAISGGRTLAGRDCLELAREKGADNTFHKPFKAADFIAAIAAAIA